MRCRRRPVSASASRRPPALCPGLFLRVGVAILVVDANVKLNAGQIGAVLKGAAGGRLAGPAIPARRWRRRRAKDLIALDTERFVAGRQRIVAVQVGAHEEVVMALGGVELDQRRAAVR